MNPLRGALLNTLITARGRKENHLVAQACRQPRQASLSTLRQILTYASDTHYGRQHHFAHLLNATTEAELLHRYRNELPPCTYEHLRPYVEKQKQGQADILFPGRPVLYGSTSGSTAEAKWIPYSQHYLHSVYNRMTHLWLYTMIHHRRHTFAGQILQIAGKDIEGHAPDGTVLGSAGAFTRNQASPHLQRLYTSPTTVCDIADYTARYYVLMRMAIEQDVTIIATANPSTIVELQHNAELYLDDYIRDIQQGTLLPDLPIAPPLREKLLTHLHPNPARAAHLKALKAQHNHVQFKHYWPHLQLLCTWKSGNTQVYIDKFKEALPPHTYHQEIGYFATECRFGMPLQPHSDYSALFPHLHFYEFVEETDLQAPNPTFLMAHELQPGHRYCPYVTTFSGLYRYNMNDIVEAGPLYENTPTVQFVQKTQGIVSLTGEKLYEQQFMNAMQVVQKRTGLHTQFYIAFGEADQSCYHIYFEFADGGTPQQAQHLAREVDLELQHTNIEYAAKRNSLRLKTPVAHRLKPQAFARFKEMSILEGARDGQFKLSLLMQNPQRHNRMKQLILE